MTYVWKQRTYGTVHALGLWAVYGNHVRSNFVRFCDIVKGWSKVSHFFLPNL